MHRRPALRLGVPLEHGEVHHPQRAPALLDQPEVLADLEPQRAERVVHDLRLVRAEEHEVAGLRARALHQAGNGGVGQELEDRRLQPFTALRGVVHLDVGEALRAVARDVGRIVVDLLARQLLAAARHAQRGHAAVLVGGRRREHLELAVLDEVRHVHQLERDAQVGLVGGIAAHRLGVGHARERVGQLDPQHLVEQLAHQPFHQVGDLVTREEGGLDVELRELRLAVGAQVLVAEAAHDLVVAVEARHHQQLLEDLRRLRQREELARLRAARHEVVARTLGRRLGQHRRLDVHEAVVVEVVAHRARHRVTQAQALLHHVATQVDVAVLEARLLAHFLVELERQRLGAVQHLDRGGQQLDLARGQVRVDRALGTRSHRALDPQHPFAAHALGLGEQFRGVGVEHDLQQAAAVAQVDEDHPAVVAAAVDPAGDGNGGIDEALIDLATVSVAHGHDDRGGSTGAPGPEFPEGTGCYGPLCGGAR